MSKIAVPATVVAACILTASTLADGAEASEAFCASRAYDHIGEPVRHFSIRSWDTDPDALQEHPDYKPKLISGGNGRRARCNQ